MIRIQLLTGLVQAVAAIVLVALWIGVSRADEPLSVISFGSCAKQDRPQPIWDAVVATEPQRFLFIGDNIYGDTNDMAVLRNKYALLGAQPGYQKLRAQCPVLATWDDHDLGANDAGAEYPHRRESQQIFLDFFGVPADSPRRKRDGVYHVETVGPPGRCVQLILLDARFFRSPLVKGFAVGEPGEGARGVYVPNTDPAATVLGSDQWNWLERQLREPAELRIIASSFQVIPNEHGWECWHNFPRERDRLFQLIRATRAAGVVFISGDRHMAEISRRAPASDGPSYPLWEVTSSSLNAPSGNLTKANVRFVNEINSQRVGRSYLDTNFGLITIDWNSADPLIRLQVRDELGAVMLQQRVPLSTLQPAP